MQKIKIAYILSVGHSGSSLLDVLLGLNKNAVSIGELKLDADGCISNIRCTCGELVRECEYWKEIDKKATQLGKSIFETVFVDSQSKSGTIDIVNFYKSICSKAKADIVVDSSKSIPRLRTLSQAELEVDLRLIFLTRTPYGVVSSNLRRGRSWIRHAFIYLLNNASKSHFASSFRPLYVSYEELVSDPELVISRINRFLDIKMENIDFANFKITSQPHMLGGNTMLYKPILKIQEDMKWKQELSSFQKFIIGIICHPLMQRVTYLIVGWIRKIKKGLF